MLLGDRLVEGTAVDVGALQRPIEYNILLYLPMINKPVSLDPRNLTSPT